jgi:hypothetical protein
MAGLPAKEILNLVIGFVLGYHSAALRSCSRPRCRRTICKVATHRLPLNNGDKPEGLLFQGIGKCTANPMHAQVEVCGIGNRAVGSR